MGYESQTDSNFTVLIADDGSGNETAEVIRQFQQNGRLNIEHYWHEDKGFRKTVILNQVISKTDCDYLIFTDGDCIPRGDFISVHRDQCQEGMFLSGGYIKLSLAVSQNILDLDIVDQSVFDRGYLVRKGQPKSFKLTKLTKSSVLVRLLNSITPTKATWNGMNSSGWKKDILAVNGFDERMQYGGLDRELGERLWNAGVQSKQIRYSAVCLHLDHPRGYSNPETWAKNKAIREDVIENKRTWTDSGIEKRSSS